jgi:hypothetical protein
MILQNFEESWNPFFFVLLEPPLLLLFCLFTPYSNFTLLVSVFNGWFYFEKFTFNVLKLFKITLILLTNEQKSL